MSENIISIMNYMIKFLSTHKFSILSVLLVVAAAVLGADSSFAMAVDIAGETDSNGDVTPEVQTADSLRESLQNDSLGLETQKQGGAATATDVRDAGLEAEDIDPNVAKFRPFRFPIEWYIANKCQQVKSKSYEHTHFRSGATELEDVLNVAQAGVGKKTFKIACANFLNGGAALTECSEVFVSGVDGYADDGKTVDGELTLYVAKNDDENITFVALNPASTDITIPVNTKFVVGATACSESQMKVAPEAFLPEADTLYLQKKIANVIITDEWKEQAKKVSFIVKDVLHNGLYNFKRKCARTHWLGRQKRIDQKIAELNGNIESVYFERGILRQIPMVYAYNGKSFTYDDFMAMTKLQFTKNSDNNYAVAFCGKNAIERIMKLANTANIQRAITFEDVQEMGISIHKWHDSFGVLEFVHDPTLDDIGYEDYIAIIDIANAVRYYKRNEQQATQDMKKTGESREAERTIISMIDCIGLKGYNAILVTPADKLDKALSLGGVSTQVESAPEGLTSTESLDKTKLYYLGYALGSFAAGTIIEYKDTAWTEFSGELEAA